MARWRKGEEQVARLIGQRHLQQVAADSETAAALLTSAGRHVESARRTLDADPEFPRPVPRHRAPRSPWSGQGSWL